MSLSLPILPLLLLAIFIAGCTQAAVTENNEPLVEQQQEAPQQTPPQAESSTTIVEVSEEDARRGAMENATPPQEQEEELTAESYSKSVFNGEPIVLDGDDVMEITGTHYIQQNRITLKGNAMLVIRDSWLELRHGHAFEHGLEARDNSSVVFENSVINTSCTGGMNWGFYNEASFFAENITQPGCNTWNYFTDKATAKIVRWDKFGATFCENSEGNISGSSSMELELCYPIGARVDNELPTNITELDLPGSIDRNVRFRLHIRNSSVKLLRFCL